MSTNIEPYAGKDLGENTFTCTAKMVDDIVLAWPWIQVGTRIHPLGESQLHRQ